MRSSLNGKIKGLSSYGKYGRASSYPGQRSKRRQKVRTQGHAGQLEMYGRWYLTIRWLVHKGLMGAVVVRKEF